MVVGMDARCRRIKNPNTAGRYSVPLVQLKWGDVVFGGILIAFCPNIERCIVYIYHVRCNTVYIMLISGTRTTG